MDHTNINDMNRLAWMVRAVPRDKLAGFSAGIIDLGLMRTSLIIHAFVWLVVKVKGWTSFQTWYFILDREVKLAVSLRDSFATHVEAGHDLTDPRSAGGLSGTELVKTLGLLRACGVTPDLTQEP